MSRRRATTDDKKRPAGTAGNHVLPNPPAVSQRDWQENCKAEKKNAPARLHCLIEGGRGINQHRTDHGRGSDGKNVFGGITKSQLLDGAIVAADKIKRRHDDTELNELDDEELKRRSIKRIVPKPTCHSID